MKNLLSAAALLTLLGGPAFAEDTVLLWGDTHLHTSNSPDAYALGNRTADPDTAYRFAKGLPAIHPGSRARVRIGTPLDFLVVSDHAEFMGIMPQIHKGNEALLATELGAKYKEMLDAGRGGEVFADVVHLANTGSRELGALTGEAVRRTVWSEIIEAAERHNDPGTFTALIGWEWSSVPDGKNLHRVIFTPNGREAAMQYLPFSLIDSQKPRDLWAWLAETAEKTGSDFVSIPHNMNISLGRMFPLEDEDGRPVDTAYAEARARWEPVAEVTQVKGDSETHPLLSPTDEFADFETYEFAIAVGIGDKKTIADAGSYSRAALLRGLSLEGTLGQNPYKFGMIGATDSHTGLATAEEDNFHGKFARDSVPEAKAGAALTGALGWDLGSQGLAGVWASENTREAIAAAFKRREVYATTGPRIQLRVFGGWDFKKRDARARKLAALGYRKGVPMGGDLAGNEDDDPPSFLIHAAKDPKSASLDRIQVVKGWVDEGGKTYERVYDVAWAGERELDENGKLPPIGNTVDIATATYANSIGAAELAAVWSDPDFDPAQRAFYYVRTLQIPTPRHTLYDTIALGVPPETSGQPATIQDRAYSSPIWYTP